MLPELIDSVETGEQSKMKITSSEADITATVSNKQQMFSLHTGPACATSCVMKINYLIII